MPNLVVSADMYMQVVRMRPGTAEYKRLFQSNHSYISRRIEGCIFLWYLFRQDIPHDIFRAQQIFIAVWPHTYCLQKMSITDTTWWAIPQRRIFMLHPHSYRDLPYMVPEAPLWGPLYGVWHLTGKGKSAYRRRKPGNTEHHSVEDSIRRCLTGVTIQSSSDWIRLLNVRIFANQALSPAPSKWRGSLLGPEPRMMVPGCECKR